MPKQGLSAKVSFAPIPLATEFGDVMEPCSAAGSVTDDSEMEVGDAVGAHEGCGGTISLQRRSKNTHNVLRCDRLCGLAEPIPIGIKTRKELREWCGKESSRKQRGRGKNHDSMLA